MVCKSPASLLIMAAKLEKDFNTAVNRIPLTEKETTREWILSPEDCIKVNVNAAYCNVTKVASLGVIARNIKSKIRFSTMTKE